MYSLSESQGNLKVKVLWNSRSFGSQGNLKVMVIWVSW